MQREHVKKADGRAVLLAWVGVFEKEQWSTGGFEIVVTLINISEESAYMDTAISSRMRTALKGSAILQDKEIMADVKTAREGYPKDHWWWWPEKIE